MGKIKSISSKNKLYLAAVLVMSVSFFIVSLTTFYGVRLALPMVTYYGRTSLYALPTTLTYLTPLIIFYCSFLIVFSANNKKRLKTMKILGLILCFIAIFDLVAISLSIVFVFDGKIIIDMMTPMFSLDVIIINSLYLLLAIAFLLYQKLDRKFVLTKETLVKPFNKTEFVLLGFYLPFATYFFGECLYGLTFINDGYIDQNIGLIIPHYLSFALPALFGFLYMIFKFLNKNKSQMKFYLISLIVCFVLTITIHSWLIIGYIFNPYIVANSLQWEYEIGLAIKMPIGIIITFVLNFTICISSLLILIFKYHIFQGKNHEQKQETLQ